MILSILARLGIKEEDVLSLFKGLVVALVGAGLTYLSDYISGHNLGTYGPLVVVFWGVVANAIRKMIDNPVSKMTDNKVNL